MATEAELELVDELFNFKEVAIRNGEMVEVKAKNKKLVTGDGSHRKVPTLVVRVEEPGSDTIRRLGQLSRETGLIQFFEEPTEIWYAEESHLEDHSCEYYANLECDRFNDSKAFFRGRCSICDVVVNKIYEHEETREGEIVEGDAKNV